MADDLLEEFIRQYIAGQEVGEVVFNWHGGEPKDFRTVAPGRWDTARMPVLGTPAARPGHPDSMVTDWSVDPG